MAEIVYPKMAVIGCGLIGSSVIRAARAAGVVGEVAAYDANPVAQQKIAELGFADTVAADPAEAVTGADLVIFATPPLAIGAAAEQVAGALKAGATVSDVGSVKAAVSEA